MLNICLVMTSLEQLISNTNGLQINHFALHNDVTPKPIVYKFKNEVENYFSAIFDLF